MYVCSIFVLTCDRQNNFNNENFQIYRTCTVLITIHVIHCHLLHSHTQCSVMVWVTAHLRECQLEQKLRNGLSAIWNSDCSG